MTEEVVSLLPLVRRSDLTAFYAERSSAKVETTVVVFTVMEERVEVEVVQHIVGNRRVGKTERVVEVAHGTKRVHLVVGLRREGHRHLGRGG